MCRRIGQWALLVEELIDPQVRAVGQPPVLFSECRTTRFGVQLLVLFPGLPVLLLGIGLGPFVAGVRGDQDRVRSRGVQRS